MNDAKGRSDAKSMLEHWNWAAGRGLMKKSTAAGLTVACRKILEALGDWEDLDVTEMDVEDVLRRFENKCSRDFSPATLAEYKRRFAKVVELYKDFLRSPATWQPASRKVQPRAAAMRPQPPDREHVKVPDRKGTEPYIEYTYPLRDDRLAVLRLPPDIDAHDARRLAAFIGTLALDFDPRGEA